MNMQGQILSLFKIPRFAHDGCFGLILIFKNISLK